MDSSHKAKTLRKYTMGEDDMKKIIPTLKILTYPQLLECQTIDDALDEKGRLMLLYLTESEFMGHWICLLKRKGTIEFFDPYGNYKPDGEKKWISKEKQHEFCEDTNVLSKLLLDSPYKIVYNKVKFQKDEQDVNTCGRHSVCRLYFKHLSLPEYANMIASSGMAPDDFVSSFVYELIGH